MSGAGDDGKEPQKTLPLDLARNQITTVRTMDGKGPVLVTSQSLKGMRVVTGAPSNSGQGVSTNPTLIVPHTVFKQDAARSQITSILSSSQAQAQGSASITIQRPTQITLSTTPIISSGPSYHVPRGPAVVANLAAPRSNIASVRPPMVVTQATNQGHGFVRPPRTPSPAQGTAWLTNTSNGSQIKGATTVLSSPVRGASVTGKPQLVSRPHAAPQSISTIRPATAILQFPFKPGTGATGIQGLSNAVTIAQVIPSRTQAVVYSANPGGQFAAAPRLMVTTAQAQRQNTTIRPTQVAATRLTIPVNPSQAAARLVAPQTAVLASGARITAVASQPQPSVIGPNRVVASQANLALGRLAVSAAPAAVSSGNVLGPTRTLNLHSLIAVANPAQARSVHQPANKVITQAAQGTIHFTPIPATLKTTPTVVTAPANRTINFPTAIVSQRQSAGVSSQAIPIANVFSHQGEGQAPTASVFIHTPIATAPRRTSPSPTPQTTSGSTSSNLSYLGTGTYFYDASGNNYSVARSFNQQTTSFAAISQPNQPIRPATLNTQVHGIVANQQMRFNPLMVVEQSRTQQFVTTSQPESSEQSSPVLTKMTSSPRPSILRKRDHEGSPLKAAKNLIPLMTGLTQQPLPSLSPPSRPDSRGNGHSSGGSTTISATSSPGLTEVNEDSMPHVPLNKDEEVTKAPPEMSPRKKPRKQQLTGSNDIDEHNDDMQFISENNLKKDQDDSDGNLSDEPRDGAPEAGQVTTVRKPASACLLNSYRQTWKATHNHYVRYSDVRPKDERRPTIMDLANQYRVQEKVNGWKVHHLSTQMEDLADQEQTVYNQLTDLLKNTESQEAQGSEKDLNRINELIKGNLQRIKIINDGMIDAKFQIMKIFDHKVHVTDIISRCASKRNFKKREKS